MFGLILKRTHEAELDKLAAAWKAVSDAASEHYRNSERILKDQCSVLDSNNHQLHQWLNDSCAAQEEAEQKFNALQELHSSKVRVVTWLMDPVRMTARLRAIEPSLRAERDGDKMVVYSNVQLTEPQLNAVNAVLLEPPNRT